MIDITRKTLAMLPRRLRWQWAGLIPFSLVAAGTEALAAVLLLGFLGAVADPDQVTTLPLVGSLIAGLGIRDEPTLVVGLGAVLLTLYVARSLLLGFVAYLRAGLIERSVISVSDSLLRGYLDAPYAFHLHHNSATLIQRLRRSVETAHHQVLSAGARTVGDGLIGLGLVGLLAVVSPLLTTAAVALVLCLLVLPHRFTGSLLARSGEQGRQLSERLLSRIQQSLGGIKEVKLSGRSSYFHQQVLGTREALGRLVQRRAGILAAVRLSIQSALFGAMVLMTMILTLRLGSGAETVSILGLFAYAVLRLVPLATRITTRLSRARVAATHVDYLYADYQMLSGPPSPTMGQVAPLPFHYALLLDDVSFVYDDRESSPMPIRDVSISIRRGESVGVVGRTGAGKSTLLNLILGLLRPTSGRITVDGHDIQGSLPRWQAQIGYVPQDLFLLDDTIRRNIAFGERDTEIDDSRIRQAAHLAQLDPFIATLPDGFGTHVGERGVRLSGGERQRVGIARALYRNPEVLVLDEPTSALDTRTETEILDAIEALRGTRTLIIVAHRLSTVERCDRILMMDEGQLKEIPTPGAAGGAVLVSQTAS